MQSVLSVFSEHAGQRSPDILNRMLRAVRTHLGMEIGFISHFVGDQRVFSHVDSAAPCPLSAGDCMPLDQGYCRLVVDGVLPELIRDATAHPIAKNIPETSTFPIGAHMSVPIRLPNGQIYGTFCCFSSRPEQSLTDRDLMMMRAFADLAAVEIGREVDHAEAKEVIASRIRDAIEHNQIKLVFQPIVQLKTRLVVGLECLSRFAATPSRSPDKWFAEAASVGLGTSLELAAVRLAVSALSAFPANIYLSVNVSPDTILSDKFVAELRNINPNRLLIEITEHTAVDNYEQLLGATDALRTLGFRIAIDDAGSGFSSMKHILELKPNVIKLDTALIRGIDDDPAKRALVLAMNAFAREIDSQIIVEGLETASEFETVRALGAEMAQGFFLGKPQPLGETLDILRARQKLNLWA